MSEIILPELDNVSFENLRLSVPAQVNRSLWTRRAKVIGMPGAEMWLGSLVIHPLVSEAEEKPWRAFLFALDGPVNWFRFRLPCNSHIVGAPVVAAGAGSGYTLPLTGMATSTRILRAGAFMTVPLPSGHYRAVCLTADLVTDSSGNATAQFKPALGETPALSTVVETVAPFVPVRMVETDNGLTSENGVSGGTFAVEEAL